MSFVRGQSEIHLSLLQDLANNLTDENFQKLKNFCKVKEYGRLGAGQLEQIKSISALFEKLQQRAIIKEGNYIKLKKLLKLCENEEAIDIVEKAERELAQVGSSNQDLLEKSGKRIAERHISGRPDEEVSREDLEWVSKRLGPDWKAVCRKLDLEDAELDQLEANGKSNLQEVIFQSLLKWRRKKGSAATVKSLSEALKKGDRTDLAETILKHTDK